MSRQRSMTAAALEVIPGTVFQTFGIGHLYKGKVGAGIGLMLSYWALQAINVALMSVFIGWVTAPMTWLAYTVFASTNVLSEGRS